jgi:hypothetical protein
VITLLLLADLVLPHAAATLPLPPWQTLAWSWSGPPYGPRRCIRVYLPHESKASTEICEDGITATDFLATFDRELRALPAVLGRDPDSIDTYVYYDGWRWTSLSWRFGSANEWQRIQRSLRAHGFVLKRCDNRHHHGYDCYRRGRVEVSSEADLVAELLD